MFSFDLKSGYHHIEIFPFHQQFLGFSWICPTSQTVKYFVFTVLPFGLASAPYIFTKALKPLLKHWRYQGIRLALYLDDGWGTEKDFHECRRISYLVKEDLSKAGFIVNDKKSIWTPCQELVWLGLNWNSLSGILSVTSKRINKIKLSIENIQNNNYRFSKNVSLVHRSNYFHGSGYGKPV